MKVYLITSMLLLWIVGYVSAQQEASKIKGVWLAKENDNALIELFQEDDGKWIGKIITSDARESIGKKIFINGVYNHEDNMWEGILIKPDNGLEVSATISLVTDQKIKIVGQKYFLTKTFFWLKQ